MTEYYTYQKKRRDYGRPCNFTDTEIRHCGYFTQREFKSDKERQEVYEEQYKQKNPNFIQLDNIAELSEHSVNTERVKTGEKGMYHKEGGWPANVDPNEQQETNKYKKKIEKDQAFGHSTRDLCQSVEYCVKQNNQIDMFEEYFENEISDHIVENLSTKTIMLFKDHSEVCKRSVSELSWHPESSDKIAASYAIMRFQQMPDKMESTAFVWNTHNPNKYELLLNAPSPVTNIAYNNKNPDIIGGGCYNGLVTFWDVRKGSQPSVTSPVDMSHSDPITHFSWIAHKLGSECVTTSTDGTCKWWDYRKLESGPLESLNITDQGQSAEDNQGFIGGTSLEYNNEAGPNKYLVGTEQGLVLTVNKKLKNKVEITTRYGLDTGRHLGPIYSIHRSPVAPKYFLTVGDWSAKLWVEDLKQPIIRTKYHQAYLADGCFSPTRNGVFFLARRDGWLDVWDYYYRQNEVAFSHKVSDAPLSCLKVNTHPAQQGGGHHGNTGKLVAIGDQDGTVTILELCDSLYMPQPKEKDIIGECFEREFRKEKNLETIKKQQEIAKKTVPKDKSAAQKKLEERKKELIDEVEVKFQEMLRKAQDLQAEEDLKELDSPTEIKRDQEEDEDQGEQQEEGQQAQESGQDQQQGSEHSQTQQQQESEPQQQQQDQQQQQQQEGEGQQEQQQQNQEGGEGEQQQQNQEGGEANNEQQ